MSEEWVYQVRMEAEETLEDVVTALSRAVWTALQQVKAFRNPDPRSWEALRDDYSKVFKRRLQFHKGCGTQPQCRFSTGVYGGRADGRIPSGPTFNLVLQGGLLRFVEGLSALACRRYRNATGRKGLIRSSCKGQIQGALHRALSPYLYYDQSCSRCPVLKEPSGNP